jgi:xylan 1,4-beta-xylosidase
MRYKGRVTNKHRSQILGLRSRLRGCGTASYRFIPLGTAWYRLVVGAASGGCLVRNRGYDRGAKAFPKGCSSAFVRICPHMPAYARLSAWLGLALAIGSLLFLRPAAAAEVFYENPVIPGDHPDPSIIRVGKDYWATSTSSEWGPQFPLLHSTDLVNWTQTGDVFAHRPEWAQGNFWAPEISEYKGRYYVYYVGKKKGGHLAVAVATADKPGGPYIDHGPLVSQEHGSIDPVPCLDENNKPYLVWKDDNNSAHLQTTIWAQPLTEDGLKLMDGEPKALIHNDVDWEGPLVEGPYVLRRGDWFYLFYSGNGCCGNDCHYGMGVARSHSLPGPWEKNPANPILALNDKWKCPGHGSIVTDERGRYWLLYHAYSVRSSVYTGREAMLDEVKFGADDWPTINNGMGPSKQAVSPYGKMQHQQDLKFAEYFTEKRMRQGWQWPQSQEPAYEISGGKLVLSGRAEYATNAFQAVFARSTLTSDYTAVTEIDMASLRPGSSAGISAFGDPNNAVGLSVGDGKLRLWWRTRQATGHTEEVSAPKTKKLQLRLTARDGFKFRFAASADGINWIPIGNDQLAKNLPPWDRSVRVALTLEGDKDARAGFTMFHLTPNDSPGQHNGIFFDDP